MKKKLLGVMVCAFAAMMAICLTGCSNEPSGAEQLEEYTSTKSIKDFQEQSATKLQDLASYSNPESLDVGKANLEAHELEEICQAVIDEDDVPAKCENLHGCYVDAATNIKTAASAYDSAALAVATGNYTEAGDFYELAKTASDSATGSLSKAGPMITALQQDK